MLSDQDVHLWCASLDQPAFRLEELKQTLSEDEQARAERFYFERDRRRFILRRGLLRLLLGDYLGVAANCVQFSYGHHGKPALTEPFSEQKLQFNLSHSQGIALYAFALGRDLGVDVERLRPIDEADQMMERFFSPDEKDAIRAAPADERHSTFLRCWIRKEAYVKALGAGLTWPLDVFSVPLGAEESAQPVTIRGNSKEASRWFVQGFVPVPDYVAAVVAEGDGWKCQ